MHSYRWQEGARVACSAQAVGERLEQLADEGPITAERVVFDASDPDTPYHDHFEWNDAVAGGLYRLDQARYLLRSVVVTSNPDGSERGSAIRAFLVVSQDEKDGYVPTYRAMTDDALRRQLLDRAMAELGAWRRRYVELTELAEVFTAADHAASLVTAA